MTAARARLPADHIVKAKQNRPNMWVQEAVFGHRFYEEQKPFMLVLEALAVCRARLSSTDVPGGTLRPIFPGLPADGTHEAVQVAVPKMGELRLMIFRGQGIETIERDERAGRRQGLDGGGAALRGEALAVAVVQGQGTAEAARRLALGRRRGHGRGAVQG